MSDDADSNRDDLNLSINQKNKDGLEKRMREKKFNNLFQITKTFVGDLDQRVTSVMSSQRILQQSLDELISLLNQMSVPFTKKMNMRQNIHSEDDLVVYHNAIFTSNCNEISIDLEEKSRHLLALKRRLTLVHSILQTVNSRIKKILLSQNSRVNSKTFNLF